jgi:Arc/MetJ-type ribon-helix-helix transcriptional regulator
MTMHLPPDIESSIQAAVHSGHFASLDDAMAEAACLLLQKLKQNPPAARSGTPDPLLGSMADHAELMDEIVEDAMRHREQQPWRLTTSE